MVLGSQVPTTAPGIEPVLRNFVGVDTEGRVERQ